MARSVGFPNMKMHLPQILFAAEVQLEHVPATRTEMTKCWVCRISTVYLVRSNLIQLITWMPNDCSYGRV